MARISIKLPYPPSVNHYWRTWQGRTLISKEGRQYRERVGWAVLQAGRPQIGGRLSLTIRATMPDKRRRDLDNIGKAVLDSLAHAEVFGDDEQIDRLVIERAGVNPGDGSVEIEITPVAA